jgi:hypothetical protein
MLPLLIDHRVRHVMEMDNRNMRGRDDRGYCRGNLGGECIVEETRRF